MVRSEITRKRTDMIRRATVLSVVHSTLDALEAAVGTLNFTKLDVQFELNNSGVNMAAKITNISVVLKPVHIRINPSNDMLDTSIS
jgi:hypothetical protein